MGDAVGGGGGNVAVILDGDGQCAALAWRESVMNVMLGLILASLTVAGGGLAVFLWSLRSGQYDDLKGASSRILFDDDHPLP